MGRDPLLGASGGEEPTLSYKDWMERQVEAIAEALGMTVEELTAPIATECELSHPLACDAERTR
jgi:hypothetical protein